MVVSLRDTFPSSNSFENIRSVMKTIKAALEMARNSKARVTMGSSALRGLACSIFESTGSTPKLCAGGPSMMILIHNICIAFNGVGNPNIVATLAMVNAANDVLNWKAKKQRILKNIPFPSAIAKQMVVKLSSANTTSAASFATSVPRLPIAIPMFAPFNALASFYT